MRVLRGGTQLLGSRAVCMWVAKDSLTQTSLLDPAAPLPQEQAWWPPLRQVGDPKCGDPEAATCFRNSGVCEQSGWYRKERSLGVPQVTSCTEAQERRGHKPGRPVLGFPRAPEGRQVLSPPRTHCWKASRIQPCKPLIKARRPVLT